MTPQVRWEGARALSAWLGRVRPASEALPPPEQLVARRCPVAPPVLGGLGLTLTKNIGTELVGEGTSAMNGEGHH